MFSLKLMESICSLNERALVSALRYTQQIGLRRLKQTPGLSPTRTQTQTECTCLTGPVLTKTPAQFQRRISMSACNVHGEKQKTESVLSNCSQLQTLHVSPFQLQENHSKSDCVLTTRHCIHAHGRFKTKLKTIFQVQKKQWVGRKLDGK